MSAAVRPTEGHPVNATMPTPTPLAQAARALAPYRQYLCEACGYVYDEAQGDPDGGLPPGTRYEDIPDDWACPLCGVTKADFRLYEAPDLSALRERAGAVSVAARGGEPGVVIVGAGRAGWQTAEALRALSPTLPITLVSQCAGDVYDKPLLSVAMARGLDKHALVRERGADAAQRLCVRLLAHTQAIRICADTRTLRTTRGKYPHRLGASGGYDELGLRRNDIDLTAEWIASGQSSLTARLSYGRQRFDDDRAADFTGATGSLNWSYRPTGKLAFNTYIARDTGQTTVSGLSFGPTGPSTITADSSRLRSVGQLRVIYDATAKIQLTGNALYVHRTLSNFALVGPRDATDNTRTLSLGLQYTPTRSLQFACNVAREVRSSSVDKPLFSTVTYPYHVNTTSCSGQFVLQ